MRKRPVIGCAAGGLRQRCHRTHGWRSQASLARVISNHKVIPYRNLIAPFIEVWWDPENRANIQLIYSNDSVPATSSWNREHLWPRSRGNSDQLGPDDSDLFHVVPSDIAVNTERGSLSFDESDTGDPKSSLTNLPAETSLARLAYIQNQRYWIEHSFHEAKNELGMAQY